METMTAGDCVTVNVRPAMPSVPLRCVLVLFAVIE